MNVFLLCKDSDFDLSEISDIEKEPIEKDLGLNNIFSAMADGDEIILNTSMKVIFRFMIFLRKQSLLQKKRITGLLLQFLQRGSRAQ